MLCVRVVLTTTIHAYMNFIIDEHYEILTSFHTMLPLDETLDAATSLNPTEATVGSGTCSAKEDDVIEWVPLCL